MSKKRKRERRKVTFSQMVFAAIAVLVIASFLLTLMS